MAFGTMGPHEGDDEQVLERMASFLGPGHVDQMIRQAIQACWIALPKERRNPEELASEVRRIVERALKDFRDDSRAFRCGG